MQKEEVQEKQQAEVIPEEQQTGVITSIQLFSLNDGPGIRTTVFLKGCRLNCKWCHNPEGNRRYPEVYPFISNCTGCKKCVEVCPTEAITFLEPTRPKIDKSRCIVCLQCVEICPYEAMVQWGEIVNVKHVIEEVEKDKPFYKNSGGGMTLSGGEPLTQPEFARALMKCAKLREIHTALDTCGYAKWEVLESVLEWTDLVLFDLKHMDAQAHKEYCGVTNEVILENARRIAAKKVPLRIRIPVIPGRNDTVENMRLTAEFVAALDRENKNVIQVVDLLPYHPYAGSKYVQFGLEYPFPVGEGYKDEEIEPIIELFTGQGLDVTVGG
ncbi:MAG: glycyl-radical enzyme activating protein [Peptococcaceae bacterium]